MNKLLSYEVLVDRGPFRLLPKFIRGRVINIDCYWVDQRRYRREMRKFKRRLKAIKIATSYTVVKEEVAENLFSNRLAKMPELDAASLEEMCKILLQNWDNYKITPTRFLVPPWIAEEIVATYRVLTEANYHKWNAKRLGLDELSYRRIIK